MGQYISKEWTEDVTTGSPEAPEVEKSPNETTTIEMPFRNNENHLWWDPYNRRVVQVNSFPTLGMYEKRGIEREKIV